MELYTIFFFISFFVCLGIFLVKTYNIMKQAKELKIDVSFLLFLIFIFSYYINIISFQNIMFEQYNLNYLIYILNFIFVLTILFFFIEILYNIFIQKLEKGEIR